MQNRWSTRRLAISVLVAIAAPTAPAESALFVVDTTVDAVDQTPGDGVCQTIVGECTLRAAVQEANALAGPDSIAVPAGTYVLSLGPDGGLPDAATGDLDLTDAVMIAGMGAATTIIDGNFATRIFERSAPVDVLLSALTVRNGNPEFGDDGGDILVAGGGGMVTVADCVVRGGEASSGGGIFGGPLTVLRTVVTGNFADNTGGGIAMIDGIVRDSAVWGNGEGSSTSNGDDVVTSGGGMVLIANTTVGGTIENFGSCTPPASCTNAATVTLANVTAGAVRLSLQGPASAGSITMRNSIVGTCDAAVISEGYNLLESSPGGCFVAGDLATNLIGVSALLGPLDLNGGPTPTQLPLTGSPAIDAANPAVPGSGPPACEGSDQRGVGRPQGGQCDIGAVEVVPTTTTTTTTTTTITTTTSTTLPPPLSRCTSKKVLHAARKALAKTKCHSRAVGRGVPLDPVCVTKAETKFVESWAKEEAKGGCLTTGDAAAIEDIVDAFIDDVVSDLVNAPGPSKCTAKKLGFTGKAALARAKCLAKAVGAGVAVDLECFQKSTDKLRTNWFKAEKTLDCQAGTGDLATIGGKVGTLVSELGEALNAPLACGIPGYPTCGGTCATGTVCRPLSGSDQGPQGFCACVAAGGPTDCPAGTAYLTGGGFGEMPLGCAPIPTCNDINATGYPDCLGGVPPGAVCQGVRILFPFDAARCIALAESSASCGSTCSGGGGVCPAGQVCVVAAAGGEGIDCGCVTPPYCLDAGVCGGAGNCPDGTCFECPSSLCPAPVCLCSSD